MSLSKSTTVAGLAAEMFDHLASVDVAVIKVGATTDAERVAALESNFASLLEWEGPAARCGTASKGATNRE